MKDFFFEEKGTWVSLNIKEDELNYLWDSNELDYKKWPEKIRRSYAKEILKFAKKVSELPDETKVELYFYAKGVAEKKGLYKLYFRNKMWSFSEKDTHYIKETEKEALDYFGIPHEEFLNAK